MRPARTLFLGLLAASSLAFGAASAPAPARLALVIGNGAYQNTRPLPNPPNDAADMKAALEGMGFQVSTTRDSDLKSFEAAVAGFTAKIRPGDVVLVFYAGHGVMGMESPGSERLDNYLIPVDARFAGPERVPVESVGLQKLLAALEKSRAGARIVVLDACRDNPFAESWPATTPGAAQGLVQPSTASLKGVYIAFATGPGDSAADGVAGGRNGLFTQELLKRINAPGLSVNGIFEEVSAAVEQASSGDQVPFFVSGDPAAASLVLKPGGPAQQVAFDPVTLDLRLQREALACGLPLCLEAAAAAIRDPIIKQTLLTRAAAAHGAEKPGKGAPVVAAPGPGGPALSAAAARLLAADQGQPNGWARIAQRFVQGTDGFPQDAAEAMRWWRAAADKGSGLAAYDLAIAYHEGLPGVARDQREAYRWIVRSARAEHPAAYALGGRYNMEGIGGRPKSDAEAAKWFQAGAGREDAISMLKLAQFHRDGLGGMAKDPLTAQAMFYAAANYGDPTAMFETGWAFFSSDGRSGFPKDEVEALKWFRKAYDAGYGRAATFISFCYEHGKCGVASNPAEAFAWQKRGADAGDLDAMVSIAMAYEVGAGYGLKQNKAEAGRWYRRAAVAGSGFAQTTLLNARYFGLE